MMQAWRLAQMLLAHSPLCSDVWPSWKRTANWGNKALEGDQVLAIGLDNWRAAGVGVGVRQAVGALAGTAPGSAALL